MAETTAPELDPVTPAITEAPSTNETPPTEPVVTPPDTTPEVLTEEALLELKQPELLKMARDLGYPAKLASAKATKPKLSKMILAGSFPNEEFKALEPVVETPVEEGNPEFAGFDMTVPADARIVFGGPVLNKKPHPFGFSVVEVLTEEEMEKYGTGKGVTYHSKQGTTENQTHTYKIVY